MDGIVDMSESGEQSFGLKVAKQIAQAQGSEWKALFIRLRQKKQLSVAVREMNVLASDPTHGETVRQAFRRIGLDLSD